MQRPPRPTGVTVLTILDFIDGIALLLLGAFLSIGSAAFVTMAPGFLASFVAVIGGALLLLGVLTIIVGWGFMSGKGWAWTLTVVLYILGATISLLNTLAGSYTYIVGIVINLLILRYLWRPNVRAYFGKGMASGSMLQSPSPPP